MVFALHLRAQHSFHAAPIQIQRSAEGFAGAEAEVRSSPSFAGAR